MDGVGRMSLQNKATIRCEVTHGYTSQSALATLTSCDRCTGKARAISVPHTGSQGVCLRSAMSPPCRRRSSALPSIRISGAARAHGRRTVAHASAHVRDARCRAGGVQPVGLRARPLHALDGRPRHSPLPRRLHRRWRGATPPIGRSSVPCPTMLSPECCGSATRPARGGAATSRAARSSSGRAATSSAPSR